MDNLDKFRKNTLFKLIVMSVSTLLPIIIIVVMSVIDIEPKEDTIFVDILQPDMRVLAYILLVGIEAFVITKIVKYGRIMTNDEYANKVYISKHDERNKFIQMKADNLASKIFLYVIAIECIFLAFTDRSLFYPVFIIFIVYLCIYFIVYVYFHNKY